MSGDGEGDGRSGDGARGDLASRAVPAEVAYPGGADPFRAPPPPPVAERIFPIIGTLRGYSKAAFRIDLVAGVTVAALAIPSGMGYATIAGLPVEVGLYALLLPVIAYALLGTSKRLVVGPEGAVAAMVAGALAPLAAVGSPEYVELAAALAVLTGLVFLLARVVRLGVVTDYLSAPVLVGYITGIAITLMIGQLPKLLGVPTDADGALAKAWQTLTGLPDLQPATAVVGLTSVAALVLLRRRSRTFPAALVVVVGSLLASWALDLATRGVKTTGEIPAGLPVPGIPWEGLAQWTSLVAAAVGIFFVSFSDAILTSRSFAARHGETVDANGELVALGAVDVASGLSGAFPLGASGSRTSVNDQMNAQSQVGQLVAAGVVAVVLLFLTGPIQYLPDAVLAAVILVASATLIVPSDWAALRRSSLAELAIAALTAAGVLTVGVIPALLVAMLLSLIDFARRAARPHDAVEGWLPDERRFADIERHPAAVVLPGLVIYRFDSRLFYGNADYFVQRVKEALAGAPQPVHALVLDAAAFSDTDATAAQAVEQLVTELRRQGVSVHVAELGSWPEDEFGELGLRDLVGADRFHGTVEQAVRAAQQEFAKDD